MTVTEQDTLRRFIEVHEVGNRVRVPAEVAQQGPGRLLGPASSPETNTLLGGSVAGSVSTSIAAVFGVFTT